ncbi:NUC169 domain-containing protein [Fomitopsis serialis]|uniref:NUC169 domain-containing protein n=1 Tax=Fomitopsis serialis TaxID=139415 RepID=UPI0020089399|nr:NUC169 domain-containing protein [Neoantrodia serialis]KAH9938426.1 NUC169 domain-containing protein [Neoantrodia serialis]
MGAAEIIKKTKKRKAAEEALAPAPFPVDAEEDGEDDGEADEFPEIDTRSDSEGEDEDGSADEEDEEDEDEDEDEESEVDTEDDDLRIYPKPKTVISDITGHPKRVYPEIEADYDSDSSTEDTPNRVGNIPMHWYDDLPHVGYDINGKKVLRPARGDELDKFLETVEDPTAWTSAFDKNTQMDKPLSEEELDLIRRLQENENPDAGYNPYEPTVEWFTGKGKEEVMPLSGAPEPKRRWVPSKWEKQKVMKIVRAIRSGRIVPNKPKNASAQPQYYAIWNDEPSNVPAPLPAPKPRLPTHAESYNPPEEYLPTEEERKQWEETDKEDRERDFLPQKYGALRLLDLYLAPRVQRVKLQIDPNSLIPKLPSPNSLKPFPVYKSLQVSHDKHRVRALSVSPDGAWAVSGDENGNVGLWEVMVGKEVKTWKFQGKVGAVEWCPRTDISFFVVGIEEHVHFIIPPNLPTPVLAATQALLAPATLPPAPATPSPVKWVSTAAAASSSDSPILTLNLPSSSGLPKQIVWHRKGDYLSTVSSGEGQGGVWIHQISRRHSQAPFRKVKGTIQLVLFHPTKPHFFVATQRYVRLYNLAEQKLLKTLTPGIRWIACMDVHPSGDHLIVGGYDRKLCWFDLELSDKPYKILRYHARALRSIFHARVYNDLMTNPLIVPLKILRGHSVAEGLGVLQVRWCPKQPWLVSAGADGEVAVWCS